MNSNSTLYCNTIYQKVTFTFWLLLTTIFFSNAQQKPRLVYTEDFSITDKEVYNFKAEQLKDEAYEFTIRKNKDSVESFNLVKLDLKNFKILFAKAMKKLGVDEDINQVKPQDIINGLTVISVNSRSEELFDKILKIEQGQSPNAPKAGYLKLKNNGLTVYKYSNYIGFFGFSKSILLETIVRAHKEMRQGIDALGFIDIDSLQNVFPMIFNGEIDFNRRLTLHQYCRLFKQIKPSTYEDIMYMYYIFSNPNLQLIDSNTVSYKNITPKTPYDKKLLNFFTTGERIFRGRKYVVEKRPRKVIKNLRKNDKYGYKYDLVKDLKMKKLTKNRKPNRLLIMKMESIQEIISKINKINEKKKIDDSISKRMSVINAIVIQNKDSIRNLENVVDILKSSLTSLEKVKSQSMALEKEKIALEKEKTTLEKLLETDEEELKKNDEAAERAKEESEKILLSVKKNALLEKISDEKKMLLTKNEEIAKYNVLNKIDEDVLKKTVADSLKKIKLITEKLNALYIANVKLINQQKYVEDLRVPLNLLEIKSIQFEFEEGNIKHIQLKGKYQNEEHTFINLTPIAFSSITDYNYSISLHSFNFRRPPENYKYRINLGDIMDYDPEFYNDSEDYSPRDTAFRIKWSETKKIWILTKPRIDKLLDARIYTDLIGLTENSPNGLVQTEVSRKIILRPRKVQLPYLKRHIAYYGFLNYIEPVIQISKLEDNNKQIALKSDPNNRELKTASTIDLMRYNNFNLGFKLNAFVLDFSQAKSSFHTNFGVNYLRTAVSNDSAALKEDKAFNVNSLFYFCEVKWQVKQDHRFGFSLTPRVGYFDLVSDKIGKTDISRLGKNPNNYFVYSVIMDASLNMYSNSKLFFRGIFNSMVDDMSKNFFQVQLGVEFDILKRRQSSNQAN